MTAFRFYHPIEIRYGDLDPQGHVNNAKYLTYFEQTRVSYVVNLGLWGGGSFFEIGFILADIHLSFKAPLHFGQKVQVGTRVTRLGNKSLTMEYALEDTETGQTLAISSSVLVTYDYHRGKTIPIPEHWRKAITDFENLPQEA